MIPARVSGDTSPRYRWYQPALPMIPARVTDGQLVNEIWRRALTCCGLPSIRVLGIPRAAPPNTDNPEGRDTCSVKVGLNTSRGWYPKRLTVRYWSFFSLTKVNNWNSFLFHHYFSSFPSELLIWVITIERRRWIVHNCIYFNNYMYIYIYIKDSRSIK